MRRELPHIRLAETTFGQRAAHRMLARCPRAGPIVAQVVYVRSIDDRCHAKPLDQIVEPAIKL